jgi:ligand-binding SRPBCC domain-containing protein
VAFCLKKPMATVEILTRIEAPIERCFQLALSVDLHALSTKNTQETLVGGVQSGILKLGESVTFRAKHFGIWQTLTSKVTEMHAPAYFCDEMQQGAFKWMKHEHHFLQKGSETIMRDVFKFESPFGWVGKLVDALFLKQYLTHFLKERCDVIKKYAEGDNWQQFTAIEPRR